jgi:4-oxalocrotonate tautomerase
MPFVNVYVPEGSLTLEKRRLMIEKITDAVVEAEGLPHVRPGVYVLVNDVPDGGWGIGGRAYDRAALGELVAQAAVKAAAAS